MKPILLALICLAFWGFFGLAFYDFETDALGWALAVSAVFCAFVFFGLLLTLYLSGPEEANRRAGQPIYRTADRGLIEAQTRRLQAGNFTCAPDRKVTPVADWQEYAAQHKRFVTRRAQLDALFAHKAGAPVPNPYRKASPGHALWAIEYAAETERLQHIEGDAATAQATVHAPAQPAQQSA
jgi:hypothetical protein